ncbi:DUF222 domain-containing protein [Kutzneria viridogrisea]|uniref:DUF222 domain-containing protein n=1 Tax=Kutzneria viridogrisea TaxID=47990 RepID=UPI00296E57D6
MGRELAARLDPDGREPREPEQPRRELYVSPRANGSLAFRGVLDAESGQILTSALDTLAKPDSKDDPRSTAERNGDAFADLLAGHAGQPHVTVTVPLAELENRLGTPVSERARRLACDAKIVPMVLGTRSEPLDVGRSSYVVPQAMRRALEYRDGGCAFPGCGRLPRQCHAHHVRHVRHEARDFRTEVKDLRRQIVTAIW